MQGFVWPSQRDLLVPYREPYFNALRRGIFATRDHPFGALLPRRPLPGPMGRARDPGTQPAIAGERIRREPARASAQPEIDNLARAIRARLRQQGRSRPVVRAPATPGRTRALSVRPRSPRAFAAPPIAAGGISFCSRSRARAAWARPCWSSPLGSGSKPSMIRSGRSRFRSRLIAFSSSSSSNRRARWHDPACPRGRCAHAAHIVLRVHGKLQKSTTCGSASMSMLWPPRPSLRDPDLAALEGLQRALALGLCPVAVNGGRFDAVAVELEVVAADYLSSASLVPTLKPGDSIISDGWAVCGSVTSGSLAV